MKYAYCCCLAITHLLVFTLRSQSYFSNGNNAEPELLWETGIAAGAINCLTDIGGKTGTTNDYTDGWFMGVTPRLVVGTWVGGEDRWIRFLNIGDGQGARLARPIVAAFLQKLEKDPKSGYDYNAKFQRPAGDLGIEINCAAYQNGTGAGPVGDEEEFSPDIYGDEAPDDKGTTDPKNPKLPAKKPDGGFGDEYDQ